MRAAMKARHMAHHFHDETGNFGITNFTWDKLFGTFYEREQRPEKSPTVFNLGYTPEVAARYPWVSRLSGGVVANTHPRRRARDYAAHVGGITVRPVAGSRARRAVVELPFRLYAGDPTRVPPLQSEVAGPISLKSNPWFEPARAASYLAGPDGGIVGRV